MKNYFRFDIINSVAMFLNATDYLEIGVQNRNSCFDKILVKNKTCIDPDPNAKADFILTSDEFFDKNEKLFDIIFIDGLHHSEQVYRDIDNALRFIKPDGVIICHDMSPEKEEIQRVPRETKEWTGDCWKAFVQLRLEKRFLNMHVVNTDYGVGIISKSGEQHKISFDKVEYSYNFLDKNRKELLNLISVEDFLSAKVRWHWSI